MEKKFYGSKGTILLIFIAAFVSITFISCGGKGQALGLEDEIIVIADSLEYHEFEDELLTVFGKIIYTPQPEKLFELRRKSIVELDNLKRRKNIIVIAPLNSGGRVSEYIENSLDSTVTEMVQSGEEFVFNKPDLWAQGQLVMFLTAPSITQLENNLLRNSENLLHYFKKASDQRLYSNLYNSQFEKKKVEAELLRDYGWIIYVQQDFHMAVNNPEDNFVWLRRAPGSDMERWLFVHWIENASPESLHPDSVKALRDELTNKFYRTTDEKHHVEIADDYLTTSEVNFKGRYAVMTQGLWRMDDKSMGGPFVNYTFYDEETRRLYMLDGAIYAPKYYKKKLIQQVDVVLHSFMTKSELSEDKIENLMDELD